MTRVSGVNSRINGYQFGKWCVAKYACGAVKGRSEEHTSELQSLRHLVCRLLLEKKKKRCVLGPGSCGLPGSWGATTAAPGDGGGWLRKPTRVSCPAQRWPPSSSSARGRTRPCNR